MTGMGYTVVRPSSHEEWLDERKKGIGSSEAGTIMRVNRFDTPYRLWRRKTGQEEAKMENEAMMLGHALEDAVARLYADTTGAYIIPSSAGDWIARDTAKGYLQVSPDRLYYPAGAVRKKSGRRILEIKTTSLAVDKEDIPSYWYCQVQYQMGVMGIGHATVAWLSGFPRLHFDYKDIEFNATFYGLLIAEIDRFWNTNVLQNIPPSPEDSDISIMFPKAERKSVAATDSIKGTCGRLRKVSRAIERLEESRTGLEGAIKTAMGDAELLIDLATGEVLAQWRNSKEGHRFNSAALKKDDPVTWAKYLEKTAGARRFQLTK